MLLTIDEIKEKLDERYLPLEPLVTGSRMLDSNLNITDIEGLEIKLNTKFPPPFKDLILRYDFGNLTIGPIAFGYECDYIKELEKYNLSVETAWWAGDPRPSHIVLIAVSDPYAICLNCESGQVLAFLHEQNLNDGIIVSASFELFFRGVGTIHFKRTEVEDRYKLAIQVIRETYSQGEEFWIQLAA